MTRQATNRLIAFATVAAAALWSGVASAQTFLGEHKGDCTDREIVVWGQDDDVHLFRGETEQFRIPRDAPVVWFCGRTRQEFNCAARDRARELKVIWERSGVVLFQCYD